MALEVKCEGCGKTLKARDELAGKKVKCPACAAIAVIPPAAADDGERGPHASRSGGGADRAWASRDPAESEEAQGELHRVHRAMGMRKSLVRYGFAGVSLVAFALGVWQVLSRIGNIWGRIALIVFGGIAVGWVFILLVMTADVLIRVLTRLSLSRLARRYGVGRHDLLAAAAGEREIGSDADFMRAIDGRMGRVMGTVAELVARDERIGAAWPALEKVRNALARGAEAEGDEALGGCLAWLSVTCLAFAERTRIVYEGPVEIPTDRDGLREYMERAQDGPLAVPTWIKSAEEAMERADEAGRHLDGRYSDLLSAIRDRAQEASQKGPQLSNKALEHGRVKKQLPPGPRIGPVFFLPPLLAAMQDSKLRFSEVLSLAKALPDGHLITASLER